MFKIYNAIFWKRTILSEIKFFLKKINFRPRMKRTSCQPYAGASFQYIVRCLRYGKEISKDIEKGDYTVDHVAWNITVMLSKRCINEWKGRSIQHHLHLSYTPTCSATANQVLWQHDVIIHDIAMTIMIRYCYITSWTQHVVPHDQ